MQLHLAFVTLALSLVNALPLPPPIALAAHSLAHVEAESAAVPPVGTTRRVNTSELARRNWLTSGLSDVGLGKAVAKLERHNRGTAFAKEAKQDMGVKPSLDFASFFRWRKSLKARKKYNGKVKALRNARLAAHDDTILGWANQYGSWKIAYDKARKFQSW